MASNGVNPSQSSLPLFQGAVYDIWSTKMKTLFISQDLWDLVEKGYSETGIFVDTQRASEERYEGVVFHSTSHG